MLVRVFDIKWDTDGEDIDLPKEVRFEVEEEDDIADKLSDYYGFCVFRFDFEKL